MTEGQSVRLKKKFLESFSRNGNITAACRDIGLTRRATVYEWQERDEEFALAFREAEIMSTEWLELEAYRRAHDGVIKETPIIHNGEVVSSIIETKYSDTLLIFLLKARAPEKYRENIHVETEEKVGLDQARKLLRIGSAD